VVFVWTAEGTMVPLPRFRKLCDELFAVHEEYPLIEHHGRNMRQHRAFFASVGDVFDNLAEEYEGIYPSAEHLREWALCQTEFCTVTHEVYETRKDAIQAAKALRRLAPYAVISVVDTTLVTKHAMSQSVRAMGKEVFEASCKAVLDVVAGMARMTPAEARREGERSTRRNRG
jgi:hypothetical protein